MTGIEKEKIINGIDVSECEKLGETIDGFTCGLGKRIRFANEIITKHNLCKDNPDCYFKQLKRLQEENEKLKENQCCPETCEYIATEINYKVNEIIMKDTGENIGSIKVKWVLGDSEDVENN